MASTGYSAKDRFQPPSKLLNKTAATGFAYLSSPSHHHQQQLPITRSFSHGAVGYNSLPRQRSSAHNSNAPGTHTRRKMVNSALQDYLKSLNSMTRSIVLETETVEKNQCNWKKLDTAHKEDLMNDHFVPADVRLHYEYERANSRCSFTSTRSADQLEYRGPISASQGAQHEDDLAVENRLSQPGQWQRSRSTKDLVYENEWSSHHGGSREEMSLSQPSLSSSYDESDSSFNRLHKKQLSFRPSHKHMVKPRQAAQTRQLPHFRSQLGSDGESPRTSDEDYESVPPPPHPSPLAFQRSKLRSYSMRSKRGASGSNIKAGLRSSVRTSNRIRAHPEEEASARTSDSTCRPSHYHSYSNTSTETDFDEAIDMPDDALLLDHVSRKSSTETDTDDVYHPSTTARYSRARRSLRTAPKIILPQSEVHINHSACDDETESTASFSTANTLSSADGYLDGSARPGSELYRSISHDSLDMDSVSIAPSEASKYPNDDEESMVDPARMTPDSILSSCSGYSSCRPRSKNSEIAVMRNRKGKRGGSHIKVSTSEFADRHTQFRSNLHKSHLDSCQSSATTTRANSPASSVSSFPAHEQDSHGYLKAPTFRFNGSKHDSTTESMLGDGPCSPDRLSGVCSPPCTPLAISYTSNSHLRKNLTSTNHEHRESGYISSSSESFQVPVVRR